MTGPAPQHPTQQPAYHRPADVARMLRCSEWWVKEQARRGRIPYCWIGGAYLFTDQHVTEIVRLYEVQPTEPVTRVLTGRAITRHSNPAATGAPVVQLRARPPRRIRNNNPAAAADRAAA